jgi:8-oxo-dGTP pyrophosphatase MutT (NUDIX family)
MLPLNSYGIILFRETKEKCYEYLTIRRKNSFGYVELLRGHFNPLKKHYVQQLIDETTFEERQNIRTKEFAWLWNDMWLYNDKESENEHRYKNEFTRSKINFETLISTDYFINKVKKSPCLWEKPEWGFPKGRINSYETSINCALREMEEESGISSNAYTLLKMEPLIENFTGTDGRQYRQVYYVARTKDNTINITLDTNNLTQMREVSKIAWMSLKEITKYFRPYNRSRVKMITKLEGCLMNKPEDRPECIEDIVRIIRSMVLQQSSDSTDGAKVKL